VSHAATADAFSVDPAACAGGLFVTDVGSDGTLVCGGPAQGAGGQIQFADGSGALVASSAFTFDEASASLRVTRLETAVDNGVRHTTGFADIASALADVPAAGGVLFADSDEDDATPLHQTNPAQADGSSGKRASLVMDTRGGGLRLLSSMPEYPTGPTGADERRVPFVFQTRLEDHQQVYDDDGSGEEWNCGLDVARCTGDGATLCITDDDCARTVGGICPVAGEGVTDPGYEWKNCPYGNSSWGIAGGSRQYWHSGQCNVGASSQFGTSALCGGPHILEVRYPYTPGKMTSKPIFAVGNGGVSIFEPEYKSAYWRSFLTMFRADVGAKANHPMYVFDRDGFMADGGAFFGGSPFFPGYAGHTYTQFNAAVHHDILPQNPAFVVWGPMGSTTAAETGPAARFYDPSNGKFGFVHPQYEREAFGFYNHSRLYLGSYQDSNPSIEESQFIEWEGRVKDGSTTRLGLSAEPTAANFIALPNASGTLALEQSVVTLTGDQTVTGTKRFTGEVSVDGALRFGAGRGPQTCLARDPKGNALFIDANCDGALGADEVPLDRPRVEPERDLTCSTILALQADVTSLAEPGAQGAYSFVTADGSVPLLMPRAGVFHDLQVEVAGLEAPCAYEARLVVNDVETALGCDVGGNGLADCANGVERITSASRDKVRLSVRMAAHQGACSDRAEAITVSLCWSSSRPTE
jgi:hypothetical protein